MNGFKRDMMELGRKAADTWHKVTGRPTESHVDEMMQVFEDARTMKAKRDAEWMAFDAKAKEIDRRLDLFRSNELSPEERDAHFQEAFRLIMEQNKELDRRLDLGSEG